MRTRRRGGLLAIPLATLAASLSAPAALADGDLARDVLPVQLGEIRPGVYSRTAPALVMAGRWGLRFSVTPKQGGPFTAPIVDRPGG